MIDHDEEVTLRLRAPVRISLPQGPPPPGGFPALVALHGHGETPERLARHLRLPARTPYARIHPGAPHPILVGRGEQRRQGRSWYVYTGDAAAFAEELRRAERLLLDGLEEILASHPIRRDGLVLMGFSQGGYLAATTALRHRDLFRGLVAVSSRIKTEILESELAGAAGYPVLVVHGNADDRVPPDPQRKEVERLLAAGLDVRTCFHPGGHHLGAEVGRAVHAFVTELLEGEAG